MHPTSQSKMGSCLYGQHGKLPAKSDLAWQALLLNLEWLLGLTCLKKFQQKSVSMHMCCTQVCWEKFTRYFDVEEKFVHLTNDCFVLTPEKAIELVDENTIGETVSSSPCLP
jgi:hypothetical protein